MAIPIIDGFDVFNTVPIDSRITTTTIALRDAISATQRYWGLTVVVTDDTTPANNGVYYLKRGYVDTTITNNSNWFSSNTSFADSTFEIYDETNTTTKVKFDLDGAASGFTTTLDFNQSADRVITFPNLTGTLALTSETSFSELTNINNSTENTTLSIAYGATTGINNKLINIASGVSEIGTTTTINLIPQSLGIANVNIGNSAVASGTMTIWLPIINFDSVPDTTSTFGTSSLLMREPNDGTIEKVTPSGGSATQYLNGAGGWTTPAGSGGTISGTIAAGQIAFASSLDTIEGSANFVYDSIGGNVGIGTTSPVSKLNVEDTSTGIPIIALALRNAGSGTGTATGIKFAAVNSGSGVNNKAAIYFENTGVGNGRGTLHFTNNNTADNSDTTIADSVMSIKNNGNVGIGISSPDTLLHIYAEDPILTIQDRDTGMTTANATLRLAESGASDALDNYWDIKAAPGNGNFDFSIVNSTLNSAITILRGNNYVGIGNTNPSVELDVTGAITSSSVITGSSFKISGTPTTDAGFSTSTLLTRDSSGNVDKLAASGGGTTKFLRANGTWAVPSYTTEVNDLTAAVTWANIPIANVPTGTTGSTVALGNHTHTFASLTSKPTTIAGYGITNFNTLGDARWLLQANTTGTLTNAASMSLTGAKHYLTHNNAARTFTIAYAGDDITIRIVLTGTTCTYTFPTGSLCISEGVASGNNTCTISGVADDNYIISIKKIIIMATSVYFVIAKNFGQ